MRTLFVRLSRVLARLEMWNAAAWLLLRCGPIDRLDRVSEGRLQYCLLMSCRTRAGRRMFARLLRRDRSRSPEAKSLLAVTAYRFGRFRLAGLLDRAALRQDAHPRNAALEVFADFDRSVAEGSIFAAIAALVDGLHLPQQEDVVLVSAGERYLPMFSLWLEQAGKYLPGRVAGMALDAASARAMHAALQGRVLDLSRFFAFDASGKIHPRSRQLLWVLRVMIVRELLRRGHKVLSFDLDAMPVAPVGPMLERLPAADLIVQQDYSLPVDVARKLGFVLCCGVLVASPTEAAMAFFDRYVDRTLRELDDQFAINHLIHEAGVTDLVTTDQYRSFRAAGAQFVCPATSLVSRDIGSGSVIRHFQQHGETMDEIRRLLQTP